MDDTMSSILHKEIRWNACYRMDESLRMISIALAHLDEEQIWTAPQSNLPSVGNLILHLCGNIRQYAISSLGGEPDTRERDAEFESTGGLTKEELYNKLKDTIEKAKQVIRTVEVDQLERVRPVQGFEFSGVGIIMHVVEHLSYHTGQIAFWAKYLKQVDLGFYADFDLNTKNED